MYSIYLVIVTPDISIEALFVPYVLFGFIAILCEVGNVNQIQLRSYELHGFLSVGVQKVIQVTLVTVFTIGFVLASLTFFLSSRAQDYAESTDFLSNVQKEFPIGYDAGIVVDGEFIYITSDFSSGVNVYSLGGTYLYTYYFDTSQNGRAQFYTFNESVFVDTRPNQKMVGYQAGELIGYVTIANDYDNGVSTISLYDAENNPVFQDEDLPYASQILGFDSTYVYYLVSETTYKTDGAISSPWDGAWVEVTNVFEYGPDIYQVEGSNVYHDGQLLIETNGVYSLFTNGLLTWYFIAEAMFIFVVGLKILNSNRKNPNAVISNS